MSEFKVGDRVKVEFEGVVVHPLAGGELLVQYGRFTKWLPAEHITKLHDPLPTKNGAVILSDGGTAMQLDNGNWYALASGGFTPDDVLYANDQFTILYAGDDE
jgi:hypothetical protein